MNQSQIIKSRASYRKLHQRSLNISLFAIIILIVTIFVNFQIIPNINTYINSTEFKRTKINKITVISRISPRQSKDLIINVKPRIPKNKNFELDIKPVEGVNNFANQTDTAAEILANTLHKEKISPRDIYLSKGMSTYFDRYGYSMEEFSQLVDQHYYGKKLKIKHTSFVSFLINLVAYIIDGLSILVLIWYVIKKR